MKILRKHLRTIDRILRGENITYITQSIEQWDRQYQGGTWERLLHGPPNTLWIADYIRSLIHERNSTVSVLDVGCGNGALGRALLDKSDSLAYSGVDVSGVALDTARSEVPFGVFSSVDSFLETNTNTFDIIVFNEVLYYGDSALLLARYQSCATPRSVVVVSILRSWRSLFLWNRIRTMLVLLKRFCIQDTESRNRFDIAIGAYAS